MKEKKRIKIFSLFLYAFLIGGVILFYIGLKLETDRLKRENTNLEALLYAKKNDNIKLLVEVQKLEAEDKIIPLAELRLGLIKFDAPNSVIEIDSKELEQVTKIINSKYE
ncbi:MAG: hypothetical protein NTX22_14115 [Ignavibacteriales bacterium]|nr:hypothetical protein [Ignavibacteriales bacterium]